MFECFLHVLFLFGRIGIMKLTRITFDPNVMGGKPCVRGTRVTVGMILGMLASRYSKEHILERYPYLEPQDIDEALTYAAWRVEEVEVPLKPLSA